MNSLRVLIIAGGLTHERDVSVRSGRRVANVLQQLGHVVRISDLDSGLIPLVEAFAPDVIWPLVHGSVGEDGSLQALLESLGVPFIGSNSVQAMLASNKPTAKGLVGAAGVDTPGWVSLPQSLFRQLGASEVLGVLDDGMRFPVVVKPTDGGSALGISRADDPGELRAAMVDAFAYGERVMIEHFVEGHDIAVSVLDLEGRPVALPPVEIVTDDGHYNYDARYTTDTTQYFVPARLGPEVLDAVSAAAVEVHHILGLRDLSRIDFIVGEDTIWFIDANVTPGMTDTSLFPQAAEAAGSFSEVCARLVAHAVAATGEEEDDPEEDDPEDGEN